MGLTTSKGHDNDDLIDKLIEQDLIVTKRVEKAMRLVDRGRFFLPEDIEMAYKDIAWRTDLEDSVKLHLSAPCIYANALTYLEFEEGNSFLNIGSGTGFLSTIAGYLIGSSGINHGIEIHESLCKYARKKVEETVKLAETQCFDWAVPEFSCGNGLALSLSHLGQYDRVYCGAAVPNSHRRMLWELLKIGGVMVMPFRNQLEQIRRKTLDEFEVRIITSVSFSDFILPEKENFSESFAPEMRRIPSLHRLCCTAIRNAIRLAVSDTLPIYIRSAVNESPNSKRNTQAIMYFRESLNEETDENSERRPYIRFLGNPDGAENTDNSNSGDEEGDAAERLRRIRRRHPVWAQRLAWVTRERRRWRHNGRADEEHVIVQDLDEFGSSEAENSPAVSFEEEESLRDAAFGDSSAAAESDNTSMSFQTSSCTDGLADSSSDENSNEKSEANSSGVSRNGKRPRKDSGTEATGAKRRIEFNAQDEEDSNDSSFLNKSKTVSESQNNRTRFKSTTPTKMALSKQADNKDAEGSSNGTVIEGSLELRRRNLNCNNLFDPVSEIHPPESISGLEGSNSEDEESEREATRLEDCQKQRDSIKKFASEFEKRVNLLPLSKSLIQRVKFFL